MPLSKMATAHQTWQQAIANYEAAHAAWADRPGVKPQRRGHLYEQKLLAHHAMHAAWKAYQQSLSKGEG